MADRPEKTRDETSPGGIRRNRRHLVANPNDTSLSYTPSNDGNQQPDLDEETPAPEESTTSYTKTRSGRVVVQPKRLDLEGKI
eukprot:gene20776-22804_t